MYPALKPPRNPVGPSMAAVAAIPIGLARSGATGGGCEIFANDARGGLMDELREIRGEERY